MRTVIVEDDDFSFELLEYAFLNAGIIDIKRAETKACALDIKRSMQGDILWIIDGNFPINPKEVPQRLWALLAKQIRATKWHKEIIIWYSSEPAIFDESSTDVNYVFEKPNFQKLIKKVKEIIQNPL